MPSYSKTHWKQSQRWGEKFDPLAAYMDGLQSTCQHPEKATEITGSGDNVKIKHICTTCLKVVSEE